MKKTRNLEKKQKDGVNVASAAREASAKGRLSRVRRAQGRKSAGGREEDRARHTRTQKHTEGTQTQTNTTILVLLSFLLFLGGRSSSAVQSGGTWVVVYTNSGHPLYKGTRIQ